MKKVFLIAATLLINVISAQEIKFNPKTGDVEMDGFLSQINNEAKKDINAFAGQVVNKFNVAKNDIDKLLKDMAPGDVYMAAQVADIVKKPVTEVSTTYSKNKNKGWGEIAKEMGIKPGSAEFHQLKKSMKKPGGGKEGGDNDKDHGKGGDKDDDKDHGKGGHGNGHGHGKK